MVSVRIHEHPGHGGCIDVIRLLIEFGPWNDPEAESGDAEGAANVPGRESSDHKKHLATVDGTRTIRQLPSTHACSGEEEEEDYI